MQLKIILILNFMEVEKIELKKMDGNVGGKRVLLVEDYDFLRKVLAKKLFKSGFNVYLAEDGKQAVDGFEYAKPDIILLDIMMPVLNGFEVLKIVRAHQDPVLAKIPIIMLTNLGGDDDVRKARLLGASDYIIKSNVGTGDIVEKIKTFFS